MPSRTQPRRPAGGPVPGAVGAPTGPGSGADEATADQPDPQADARFVTNTFHTSLPFVTQRGRAIQSSVRGGVWPVAGLAALAGVGFVGAAASLWADRRRRELQLLAVRGVSPAGLGLKAVMETAIPLAVGAAAGGALAYGLVAWLGPSPEIEPSAVVRAAAGALGALAVALLTAGAVVTGRVAGGRGQAVRTRRSWMGLVPWELGLAALTVVSYRRLGEWGVPVSRGADVSQVDVLGLLFPVLFLVTGVAVVVRLLFLGLRPLLRASRGWPVAAYLAARRVARYRVAVLGLVAASALAAGVLGYAATLDRSLDASLRAKASTFVGSDVALAMAPDAEVPASLRDRSTEVDVYRRAFVEDDRREGVGLLAVDPATFARAAFWDASYADASLDELLDLLAAPPRDGRVPALLVGADGVPDVADAGVSGAGTTDFTIEQVAEVEAFPGMKRGVPTLVVAAGALADLEADRPGREVWVAGDRDDTLADPAAGRGRLRGGPHVRRHRRPGLVPHRVLDLRLHAVPGRGRRGAGPRRHGRLPRHPPAGAGARLRVRPAHGPDAAPAPPRPGRRAGGHGRRRLLAGPRHRAGRRGAGHAAHRPRTRVRARHPAAPGERPGRGAGRACPCGRGGRRGPGPAAYRPRRPGGGAACRSVNRMRPRCRRCPRCPRRGAPG